MYNMKKIIKTSLLFFLLLGFITILTNCKKPEEKKETPLNISIYLDLSDRLLKGGEPDQKTRDLAIVDTIVGLFREMTIGPKMLKSENKMRVFFYPAPQDPNINALASDLNIDIAALKGMNKIQEINNLKSKFNNNLSQIYDFTLQEKNWVGSDIWGFFSDSTKIDVQCIENNARNIIVILTDGFIFHVNNKKKEEDAYSYVLLQTLANPKSSLIAERNDLNNIEVLVLETAPEGMQLTVDQKQKLRAVLTDWFNEMGVKKFQIAEEDLPANSANLIKKFIENK